MPLSVSAATVSTLPTPCDGAAAATEAALLPALVCVVQQLVTLQQTSATAAATSSMQPQPSCRGVATAAVDADTRAT
jgi:hypothetical protein